MWQSASKERRAQLLAEQRIWLKQRDLECKLKASQTTDEGGARKSRRGWVVKPR
ncbi:lysozyme inhibitor LprI family protein [Paludibacterium denitrificans]|uniref:lysozyme inhibitor LprI family protein n=1 Tax=Paludibacterium denitrificans TaxID=2675226 RepID=UPI0035E3FD7F